MAYYPRRNRLRSRTTGRSKIVWLSRLTTLVFICLVFLVIFTAGLFAWYSRDLPQPGKVTSEEKSQSTRIFDRGGTLLYSVYSEQNRVYVPLSDIPKTLQEATIAIEDKDFYQNEGFSTTGYLRSIKDLLLYRRLAGGSTITQQLVKNALLTSERTIPRKVKEFILAVQVDRKYSKDEILELYLNAVPYGGTAVGVEAASQSYFGKPVKELSLVESVILAVLPQRPSYYSPHGQNPKAYIDRAKDVIRRMREDGYVSREAEKKVLDELPNVTFLAVDKGIKAPHFVFYVKELLVKEFGEQRVESGGLQVTTSLDYKLQETAEKIVQEEIEKAKNLKVGNGAAVTVDVKTSEILSMVGSKDFFDEENDGNFNATTAFRQPGSAIKPITYAAALGKGYTAATLLMDTKTLFPNQGEKDYIPVNYDGKHHGPLHMRFALASSINVPAVKMLANVGIKDMLSLANNMGLSTLAPTSENIKRFGLSITLGGGEVKLLDISTAFSSFANGGLKVEPVAILKVTDTKGSVLLENKQTQKRRVLSEEVAFIVSHMLSDNNARLITFGENSFLNVRGRTIAVKTGTTDDRRDNWTIGWTPHILVGTWVGNNDNSPMGNVASGVTGAAPIWRRIILEAVKNKPNEGFVKPDNVIEVKIDSYGGGLPVEGKPTRPEFFIKGTEPQGPSSIYKKIKVSKEDSNKLASDNEVEKGEYNERDFIVFEEQDPISTDNKNRWQEGINDWVNEHYKDDPLYHQPTEKSSRVVSSSPTPTPTP